MSVNSPLAERVRPQSLDAFIGQQHLVGNGKIIAQIIKNNQPCSMIFWGPPGVGKTTLAFLIAKAFNYPFYTLSAIDCGVKEIRNIIDKVKELGTILLFIDEIHRFNKSQQDSLLKAVEKGSLILLGATTENPSFEVIGALLSRCQVFVLKPLLEQDLKAIVQRALTTDHWLIEKKIVIKEWESLLQWSGGDGRKLLNVLELTINYLPEGDHCITNSIVMEAAQQKMALYDKNGEQHYDLISAFIKSIRGSDPNAAIYWLARMIVGGEDAKFICRRMLILASEDIGHANPNALLLASSTFQAIHVIGMPEGRILMSQCAIYLACSPKSNSAYLAIEKALDWVNKTGDVPVPLPLRNAPTRLMKNMDYGKDYNYAHNFPNNFILQDFLPENMANTIFFEPSNNDAEIKMRNFLKNNWKEKYNY